jgi:hypothetical protein
LRLEGLGQSKNSVTSSGQHALPMVVTASILLDRMQKMVANTLLPLQLVVSNVLGHRLRAHFFRSQILCQNQSCALSVDIQLSAIIVTIKRQLTHFSVFSSDFDDVGRLGDLSNSASTHSFFTHSKNEFSFHNLGSMH